MTRRYRPHRCVFTLNAAIVILLAAGSYYRIHAADDENHLVPAEKKLSPQWLRDLTARGQPEVYRGRELFTIGMPCGGVCGGQVYVRGDGTLAYWWIDNTIRSTGYGNLNTIQTCIGPFTVAYQTHRPFSPLDQGFAVRVKEPGKQPRVRTLNQDGFDDIRFLGEYPIATIDYRARTALPVTIQAEVFSPFIPLNARDSANPATILRYTVENISGSPLGVSVAGWLQNGVCLRLQERVKANSRNRRGVLQDPDLTCVHFDLVEAADRPAEKRRRILFEDFEDGTYKKWTVEGEAFGQAPVTGTLPRQQAVSGFQGKYLVNSFRGGNDQLRGRLISEPFTVAEKYLAFLIGGGGHAGKTCMNLVINGTVVRTATGKQDERLAISWWNVSEFMGKQAHVEIVDRESRGWGHINVDTIYFTNLVPLAKGAFPADSPQFGNVTLAAWDPDATATADWGSKEDLLKNLADDGRLNGPKEAEYPLGEKRCGAVASSFSLQPGQKKTATFTISWYYPARRQSNTGGGPGVLTSRGDLVGNMYRNWYRNSQEVAQYLARNFERLDRETHLFRDTYYHDSTLPRWFLARIAMPVSTLATETCQWWANGRFWAWEGVGCCHGTCTHVWNYEHTVSRLFPELARSTREHQDFGQGFDVASGLVGFRSNRAYAADGQCGTILKAYREHQTSADTAFLKRTWPRIMKALEFVIRQDGNGDGLIENSQHNTFDINFEGPNTFVGSLYLAALRAGEEMARLQNDDAFAQRCRRIYESGRQRTLQRLWDGEYFIQEVDLKKHTRSQYGTGCLSDQLFGQGWAHQVGLGYIYPRERVASALRAVWKYNWAPDVGPYNKVHKPGRPFASPGEAGLFTCTWPKSPYLPQGVRYKNEVWTGIEYQVANHMLYEGMLTEGLSIIRGIHERYHPLKHNPWNEIECGDHYARAMASWGCLLGISGSVYDGPARKIGCAPRLHPKNFRAFFTAAEGWGTLSQKREAGKQINAIEVKWGKLPVRTLVFELPAEARLKQATVTVNGSAIESVAQQDGQQVVVNLSALVNTGGTITTTMTY